MKKANQHQFLLLLLSIVVSAQGSLAQQLSNKLDQLISGSYRSVAPGCAVLVAKKGKVVYEKGFGTANLELQVGMRPEMVFRIGSMTKQYTAVAILKLAEQGKISLQDSIQKFLKEFPYKGQTLTIENLLTQTSGLVDYQTFDFHIPNAIRIDFTPQQIIDTLSSRALEFIPGSRFQYSNSNYLILGYIIEKATGKTYAKYLQENILQPAGLSTTFYDSPAKVIRNRVSGYIKDGDSYSNAGYISMSQVFSAGALLSSTGDLFKWHQALYSYKLINKQTIEKAFMPYRLADGTLSEYGYGWFIKDFLGTKTIAHGGAIDGFRSMEAYFPEQDVFVATLFNAESNEFLSVFEKIAQLALGQQADASRKDLKLPAGTLDSYVGRYRFLEDTTQYVQIRKEGDRLYADLSNNSGNGMVLQAQSQSLFYLPDIKRMPTTIEFIIENKKVVGLYWIQDKKHEAPRSER
jgi:CubicO group peptidase (beta-lactamase class C family)